MKNSQPDSFSHRAKALKRVYLKDSCWDLEASLETELRTICVISPSSDCYWRAGKHSPDFISEMKNWGVQKTKKQQGWQIEENSSQNKQANNSSNNQTTAEKQESGAALISGFRRLRQADLCLVDMQASSRPGIHSETSSRKKKWGRGRKKRRKKRRTASQ